MISVNEADIVRQSYNVDEFKKIVKFGKKKLQSIFGIDKEMKVDIFDNVEHFHKFVDVDEKTRLKRFAILRWLMKWM